MDVNNQKAIIEAILFASGKEVKIETLMGTLEISYEEIELLISQMRLEYEESKRGIEIVRVNNSYMLATKKEYFDYIYPIFDNRAKPTLTNAAMETLSIIAYNPRITRAEIEKIRGVNSDGVMYKLLELNLVEEAGKLDIPGKPISYKVTDEFLKTFGLQSLEELPSMPKLKEDDAEQLQLESILKAKENKDEKHEKEENNQEENEKKELENKNE